MASWLQSKAQEKSMSTQVKKAVFPVAGYGTRFLPATKAYPKEMLPIIDKPLIQYAVEEAVAAGCTELIFVTSHAKKAIEDHFDRNIALEQHLLQKHDYAMIDLVNKIIPEHVTCIYIRQPDPHGLGHAVLCAKSLIQDEPFAVILADDLMRTVGDNCLVQLLKQYTQTQCSVVAVEQVAPDEVSNYGVVGFANNRAESGYINRFVEKPEQQVAPSNFAAVGRYILTPGVFTALQEIYDRQSVQEVQLTDALAMLLAKEKIYALEFAGERYDCGKKPQYFRAILEYALAEPEYRAIFDAVVEKIACE